MTTNYPTQIPHPWSGDDLLTDAYRRGWNHGHGIACHNVPAIGDRIDRSVDYVGIGKTVTSDNVREYHELLCHAVEDNSRSYSPFELTAHEFNSQEEYAEDLWEAFDAGINDAIGADLATYTDADYGIEEDEELED